MDYLTPYTDKILETFTFKTKDGFVLNKSITPGQKVIMETILTKQAPDGSGKKRVHCEAHTRYGKSLVVAAATAVRAFSKHESWAIVGPTQKQAQIIMDYVIEFALGDPILAKAVAGDPGKMKFEYLQEHKKKDRITFLGGGEVRAFTAGKEGDALMGFGSPNVIEDECYLINNVTHSKVIRMLGDNPESSFLFKIGNPWNREHGLQSRRSEDYFKLIFDYKVGLEEGRITPEFLEEVKREPNFSVLYECVPPDEDRVDELGYMQLFPERLVKNAMVKMGTVQPFGVRIDGVDVGDIGSDFSVIVHKWENLMKIAFRINNVMPTAFGVEVGIQARDAKWIKVDKMPSGTFEKLSTQQETRQKTIPVSFGEASPDKSFANMKAWLYWQFKKWLEAGGKLEEHDQWYQLLDIKYRVNETNGKVEIIKKKELAARGIASPDVADAGANCFAKPRGMMTNGGQPQLMGGIDSIYPDLPG